MLSIAIGSLVRLNEVYFHPEFETHPVEYDFSQTNLTLDFAVNTVAVGMTVYDTTFNFTQGYTNTKARAYFTFTAPDGSFWNIDALYCTDVYADEIAAEKRGDVSSTDYTRAFEQLPEGYDPGQFFWICPDVNSLTFSTQSTSFNVYVYPCDNSRVEESHYADGEACEESASYFGLNLHVRPVSSMFKATQYYKD